MSQSTEPSVVAIMLTKDRPAMARQAVESFRRQTYPNKTLVIVNSGAGPMIPDGYAPDIMEPCFVGADAQTIGELRNRGAKTAIGHGAEILIHWDDDDYSHPNRIAEQVQLLQASGADVVGYSEALFWREPPAQACDYCEGGDCCSGEAWLYTSRNPHKPLGTSLCYWRRTWERNPFQATSHGEDDKFLAGLKVETVSSVITYGGQPQLIGSSTQSRMVCRIHPGNTSSAYDPKKMARAAEWRRVPEWDLYCAGVFA